MLRYILTIFAVLAAFTACREEGDSLSTTGKEKGRLVLGAISIEAEETHTRAVTIPKPQPEEVIIEIIDPDNFVVESGNIDHYANGIELFVAQYTLRAYYGNKQTMGDSPYFEGTVTFSVTEGATTQIGTITAKLANAIIIPNIPTSIVDHFIGVPTFYVSKEGEEKRAVTNGQALYVLPGEYTLGLEGTNKLGVAVNNTQQLNTEAGKVYNINGDLKLPILELPDQTAGAWAKRLYITPVNATNSKGEKYTPKGVIYKILPKNSSDWDNAISIQDNEGTGEKVIFTGLTPGTTYQVRAEMASIISNVIDVQTESIINIPNGNLDTYTITDGVDGNSTKRGAVYQWYTSKDNIDSWWTTYNETAAEYMVASSFSDSSRSNTRPTTDTAINSGSAVLIMTTGFGYGASMGITIQNPKKTATGFLKIEKHEFKSRPTALSFYYKYSPYNNDEPLIQIDVYSSNQVIGTGKLISPYLASYSSNKTRLNISYENYYSTVDAISIQFVSGTKHTEVTKRDNAKPKDAMPAHIGSQLYIDEVELIYE